MSILEGGLLALYAGTVLLRDVYEQLKRTARLDPGDARVFAFMFASMCVMWVSWFGLAFASSARLAPPIALRGAGAAAVAAGAVLIVSGMWTLRGVENIDHLVTSGPFARIRHPMYLGFALWIAGAVVWTGSIAGLCAAPLGLASVAWWRSLEERELESRYGEAYVAYRATTWV